MAFFTKLRSWTDELTGYFIYLLIIATLGPFLFGYHLAELNAPQDVISCVRKSIGLQSGSTAGLPQCIPMDTAQFGLVTSIFTLGGLCGALGAGPVSARYGRLIPMRITTAFFAAGPVAEALAPNIVTLSIGRFLSGIGAGASLVVVPIYVSEIAPPRERGLFGAFTQIMINSGIFTAQLLGYFLSHGQMWRLILAIGGLIGVSQLAGLTLAVDSPKWRSDHGDAQRAKGDLQKIRGRHVDLTEEITSWNTRVQADSEERETLLNSEEEPQQQQQQQQRPNNPETIATSSFKQNTQPISVLQVLITPPYTRATIAVMIVMVAQQFTGINSIVMYGVSLLSDLLQANSALLNIIVSLINVLVTTACAPLVDILGRKICLLSSIAGMGTSAILLGIGIRLSIPIMSAISVLLFVASFGLGLGPVPFILASELVGPEAVGATQSWALAANWIATFVVAQFFPIVNEWLGKGMVYFVFAALALTFFILVSLFVPETKGKKDADEVWGRELRRAD